MKPDLDSIYAELDIQPGCSLEEFKRAYRRRVAELHPDRDGTRPAEDQAVLRNLIRVYTAVTRFHRRYGRMPGGHPTRPRAAFPSTYPGHERGPPQDDAGDSDEARRTRATMTLVGLFIALVLLLASWSWLTSASRADASRGALQAPPLHPAICAAATRPAARHNGGHGAAQAAEARAFQAPFSALRA